MENALAQRIGAFLVDRITERAASTAAAFRKTRDDPSIEHTHKLSTMLRRLLVAHRVVKRLYGEKILRGTRKTINDFRRHLGGVRDQQVMGEKLESLDGADPFLAAMRTEIARREVERLEGLGGRMDAFPYGSVERLRDPETVRALLRGGAGRRPETLFLDLLREVYARVPAAIAGGDDAELHRLRVKYKRFRYAVELFSPDFTGADKARLKYLKTIQDCAGEAHDWLVLEEEARAFAEVRPDLEAADALARLAARRIEEHAEARAYIAAELEAVARDLGVTPEDLLPDGTEA
jgi:CHAD domain-containing protein